MRLPVPRRGLRGNDGLLGLRIAARSIFVTAEDEFPRTRMRYPEAMTPPVYRREIAHHENMLPTVSGVPHEGQHAVFGVVFVDPLESPRFELPFVQGFLPAIESVQFRNKPLHVSVPRPVGQVPIQTEVVVPLLVLGEFT